MNGKISRLVRKAFITNDGKRQKLAERRLKKVYSRSSGKTKAAIRSQLRQLV